MGRSDEEKTAEELFAEMQRDMEHFMSRTDDFVTRFKLNRQISDWYNTADASDLTGEEFKRVSRNAIRAIVLGDE